MNHPKYARLVRRSIEPQKASTPSVKRRGFSLLRKPSFLKPKFLRRALGVLILLVAVSWSFQQWIPPSKAFAAPWSPTHGSYGQRKQLTLVNSSGQTFESGTTYKVTIDTASLYNTGSLLSSCDDLRVVYQPSNTTAVELKRAVEYASTSSSVTTCATSSATKVVFQLQANIANAAIDANYYIYYENPIATTYPAADALDAYNVGAKEATFVAPFNGTTQALAAGSGTPTTATGAIRYSGGKSAMSFDGVNDYVTVANSSSLTLTSFTIETWFNSQSWSMQSWIGIVSKRSTYGSMDWELYYDRASSKILMLIGENGGGILFSSLNVNPTINIWHHIAVTKIGTSYQLFLDGVSQGTDTSAVTWTESDPVVIGSLNIADTYFSGLIDEVRLSNNARYTSNFTPSTTPFVRDEYTKLLMHFDENGDDPRNTGKAIDDSGNSNHGAITGAKYVGGLVGVDGSTTSNASTGYQSSQSYAGHEGVFIEEGTTNKITNPSFDHTTHNTNWAATQSYTQEDQFTTTRAGGALNGTSAEPTGGTRTAIDTNSKISITGGQLSFATGEAANDGVWYPVQTRAAGKLLSATITPADTNGDILFGWDTNQTGAITDALKFTAAGVLQIVPNGGTAVTVGSYTATSYQVAGIMRATGIYWFIKGGTYTAWTQLLSTSAGSANMYPAIQVGNTTAVFTLDNMRIPTATWLPTPLAYDSFTRADGAIGSTETTGPDSQVVPQLAWTGSTWTVSGNRIVNTPTLGSEILLNGSFETGNPPTSWNQFISPTTFEQSSTQAQLGTYSLHVVGDSHNDGANQTVNLTANVWYQMTGYMYVETRNAAPYYSFNFGGGKGFSDPTALFFAEDSWQKLSFIDAIATTGSTSVNLAPIYQPADVYYDNISVRALSFPELFTTVASSKSDVVAEVGPTHESMQLSETPVGLMLRLDSTTNPQNYLIAFMNAYGGNNWGIFRLYKCLSGTCTSVIYTSLYSAGTQYIAGTRLRVVLNGSAVSAYYGNTLLGSGTVGDAAILNNTIHGVLSPYSGNSSDNFVLYSLGNGGENAGIPVEPTEFLTATENTIAPYYKFGGKSVKLVDASNATQYATSINPGNTNTHTLSAYVYDGTTGNIGGTVSSSIAKLVFNGIAYAASSYVDQGGGWWRLSYSAAAANVTATYGVEVQAGKTIYVDGVQLEEKAYATTYADGTMGSGYAWTGTANDSTSTRTFGNLRYTVPSNTLGTAGAISLWLNTLNLPIFYTQTNYTSWTTFLSGSGGGKSFELERRADNNNGNQLRTYEYSPSNTWTFQSNSVNFKKNGWTNVTFAWDTSNSTRSVYVNGTLASTDYETGTVVDLSGLTSLVFGSNIVSSNYGSADSVLSDARAFSSALTSTEIADLYYSGLGSHSSLAPVATERYTDGEPPVLAWHLDEGYGTTTYDSTIYQNSGTISGPTWSEDSGQAGMTGSKSLKFDGSNDFVSRTFVNDPELNPGTSAFSVSTWFKHPSTVTGTDTLISRYSSTGSGGGYKVYMNSSGYICFDVDDDTTWSPDDSACTTVSYADSNWHHVLAIKGTSTIAVYIDGTQKASIAFTVSSSLSGSSPTFYTGIDSDGTSNPWDGFIDEVRVYNSTRSEEQINQEYVARGTNKGVSAQFGGGGASDTLSQGLVGHWKMDETSWSGAAGEVLDASGNGNNGVRVGDATTAAGKFGNGGTFDGTGDYVNLGNNSVCNFAYNSSFALSFWINPTNFSAFRYFIAKHDGGYVGVSWGYSTNSNSIEFTLRGSDAGNTHIRWNALPTIGVWTNVVLVSNGSKVSGTDMYYNGVKQTKGYTVDTLTSSTTNSNECHIGAETAYSGSYMLGQMDDYRIYNRALSPAEVRALYEYAPGPVARYTFDEGSGQSAYDKSGNSNTGTLGASGSPASDDPQWTNGKYGKALSFDGGDYVGSSPSKATRKYVTIEGWVNFNDPDNLGNIDRYHKLFGWGYEFYIDFRSYTSEPGAGYFLWLKGWTENSGVSNINNIYALPTKLSGWHYIAANYDGSTSKLYLDGMLVNQTSVSDTGIKDMGRNFTIGGDTELNTYFDGQIDDVRIYNYARTQKQIVQDMNAGHPAVGSPVGSAVAHYKFDEGQGTIARNSGNGGSTLNGTLTNMSSPATSTSGWTNDGKFNKSLNFDGSDDYINIPNSSAVDIRTNISISLWVKPTGVYCGSGCAAGIVAKNTAASNGGLSYVVEQSPTGKISLYIDNVGNGFTPQVNTWTLASFTYDGSTVKSYMNGILQTTTAKTGSITSTADPLIIGKRLGGAGRVFNGSVDEVKIYNFALSEDEVKLEYNQGKANVMGSLGTATDGKTASNAKSRVYCPPGNVEVNCAPGQNPAPVAEWNFDEGSGTSATDTSGNNNTGTLTNGPTWTSGKVGKALSFDGIDDYTTMADSNSLHFGTGDFTVTAWIKTNKNSPLNKEFPFLSKTSGSGNNGFLLETHTWGSITGDQVNISCYFTLPGAGYQACGSYGTRKVNEWNHFTMQRVGTTVTLFLNGVNVNSTIHANLGINVDNSALLKIGGQDIWGAGSLYRGIIDQIRIYNYARTPAQIAWDYNKGAPLVQYKFNECSGTTINNSVPSANGEESGNNGTLIIGASLPQTSAGTCSSGNTAEAWNNGTTGKFSSSMLFDGVDDYASIPDNTMLNLTTQLTLSGWIKTTDDDGVIIAKDDTTGERPYVLYFNSGQAGVYIKNTTVGQVQAKTINDGLWHHVLAVFDATSLQLYVDGINVGTDNSVPSSLAQRTHPVTIGMYSGSGGHPTNGQIDDARIYNYALSPVQVRDVYNNGAVSFK